LYLLAKSSGSVVSCRSVCLWWMPGWVGYWPHQVTARHSSCDCSWYVIIQDKCNSWTTRELLKYQFDLLLIFISLLHVN